MIPRRTIIFGILASLVMVLIGLAVAKLWSWKNSQHRREVVAWCLDHLQDTSQSLELRWQAARGLGDLAPEALPAIPALIRALRDDDSNVRGAAAYSLGELKANNAIPDLIEMLKTGSGTNRVSAAGALGRLGPSAKDAIPTLKEIANDPNADEFPQRVWIVQLRCKEAVALIQGETEEAAKIDESIRAKSLIGPPMKGWSNQ